jgi:FKBP-type peptidyl-prolyl cis-trans isomerase
MKELWAMTGLILCLASAPAFGEDARTITNDRDRMSYAIGMATGRSLKQAGTPDVNIDMVLQGLADEFRNKGVLLKDPEFRTSYHAYQQQMIAKMGKARDLAAWENKQAGDAFFAENGKKPGVVTLENGLQYKILKEGSGEKPTDADTVTCNYRGTLIDGVEFDSTYARNQAATFPLNRAIAGWREALKLMPVGSKWMIWIPPELAYSKQGAGQVIGPNATLIFEMELLSINKSDAGGGQKK